jgi:hypothetical protein
LAIHDQRVHHDAVVVDGHQPQHRDPTQLGFDLDDRDVCAEREGLGRPVHVVGPQRAGDRHEVGQRHRPWPRGHRAGTVRDVDDRHATELGHPPPGVVDELAGRAEQGGAAYLHRAACVRADATRHHGGVRLDQTDPVRSNVQHRCDDLWEGCLVALAGGAATRQRHVRAVRAGLHRAELFVRTGPLHVYAQPDAQRRTVAGTPPPRLFGTPPVVVDGAQGQVERSRVVAAVVGEARRCVVRKSLGLDEVAPPQRRGVQVQPPGEEVDGTFDRRGRLGTAGSPVRGGGSGRRHHDAGPHMHPRDGIGAGRHQGRGHRHERAGVRVAADVGVDLHGVREDPAVGIGRHPYPLVLPTTVR